MDAHRAILLSVATDGEGLPELALANSEMHMETGTPFVHVYWIDGANAEHVALLHELGVRDGDTVYIAVGDEDIDTALAHLSVMTLRNAWLDADWKAWLQAAGVSEVDGWPIVPHVFAGDNREAMGRDYVPIEE